MCAYKNNKYKCYIKCISIYVYTSYDNRHTHTHTHTQIYTYVNVCRLCEQRSKAFNIWCKLAGS